MKWGGVDARDVASDGELTDEEHAAEAGVAASGGPGPAVAPMLPSVEAVANMVAATHTLCDLLHLKQFMKSTYGLSDTKCEAYQPDSKARAALLCR